MDEFSLIQQFFQRLGSRRDDVLVGVGDDAAVLSSTDAGSSLVVCTDVLVEGVHFPTETSATDIGYKSLAVNLSDMAAMGATPAWATLGLTVPVVNEDWLSGFAEGFHSLALEAGVALVGGDTTKGALAVSVTLTGQVPAGEALLRNGARVGDQIWVSGTLGDAGLGLMVHQGNYSCSPDDADYLLQRLNRPTPKLGLGKALRGLATASIDISDGLVADLGHILEQSGVGASIDVSAIPLSDVYLDSLTTEVASLDLAMSFGDDYELCFTAPPEIHGKLLELSKQLDIRLSMIGSIEATPGLRTSDGNLISGAGGYRHFS